MRRGPLPFPLAAAIVAAVLAGCSQSAPYVYSGRSPYQGEVTRDVSAILDGMSAAHLDELNLPVPRGRALRPPSGAN